jgi:L-lactate dehydrogenase complex protein LldE
MFNAGHFDLALTVARHFIKVFRETSGPIITPSSSCAAMIREHYPRLFNDSPGELDEAKGIAARTYEFCEFLVKVHGLDLVKYKARWNGSVTYHHSCHFRALGLKDEPVGLIRQISGVHYLPLPQMESCCGFGGTFSLKFPHVSKEMVAQKLKCVLDTQAEWLIYADAGCAMNITGYAHRIGKPIKAMHIAELIDKALGG